MNVGMSKETGKAPVVESLRDFELHNWTADPSISFDENVMDLVMLITRNSICKQGHMGCVLLQKPSDLSTCDNLMKAIEDSIISAEINRSLFKALSSDIHAEIGALGRANRLGRRTEGCTAYITMPPCKNCFTALVASGVKEIVSRHTFMPPVSTAAEERGISLVKLPNEEARLARIRTLIYGHPEGRKRKVTN